MTWTPPPELDQPVPRKVRPSTTFLTMQIAYAITFLGVSFAFLGHAITNRYDEVALATQGIVVQGTVIGTSGGNQEYREVSYRFATEDGRVFNSWDYASTKVAFATWRGGPISIMFDRDDPRRSRLEYPDTDNIFIARRSQMFDVLIGFGVFLCYLFVEIKTYQKYISRRELLRWGTPAPALITSAVFTRASVYCFAIFRYRLENDSSAVPARKEDKLYFLIKRDFVNEIKRDPVAVQGAGGVCVLYLGRHDDLLTVSDV